MGEVTGWSPQIGIFTFGDATFYGSMGGVSLNKPVVGMAATPDGKGYWLVASDGGIFSFGDAQFYGSTGGIKLNQPIVGIAADPATGGYWMVASDGGIFSFNVPFLGSMGDTRLNKPIVGMAVDPATDGYWLVASDGGIFSFNAPFFGSTGAIVLNKPITGMEPAPSGKGYRFVASDGGIFDFGSSQFYGSSTTVPTTTTPPSGGNCTNPVTTLTDPEDTINLDPAPAPENWWVSQDEWNGDHGTQSMIVCGQSSWTATENQPNVGGQVETYPDTEYDVGGRSETAAGVNSTTPISGWNSITSTFSEAYPSAGAGTLAMTCGLTTSPTRRWSGTSGPEARGSGPPRQPSP